MSEEQTQDDFLGEIAAAATGSAGIPDDVNVNDAVPNDVADQVEAYDEHAERRDEHLAQADDQGNEDPADDSQGKGRHQKVPLGALQEERARRQQAQAELAQLQQRLAQIEAQTQQLAQQQQQAQQQAEIPAFVDDPEGHLNGLKAQFQQELENLRQGQAQSQQFVQEQQFRAQVNEVAQDTVKLEAEVRSQRPDYDAAVAHMDALAIEHIKQAYPGATEQQIRETQATALLQFALQCRQQGINPAQAMYERAVATGFQGSHRSVRSQPARQAPTSLSSVSGSSRAPDQRGNVSAKDIASMSNADFDKFFNEMAAGSTQRPAF
ncbi:hypothetical protein HP546_19035 [Pseudomonas sp. CM25]|uniref:hypothetical protein n=1 Tax=Pseudomonas sp. CM25 TaxID=2738448 RepID=UPI001556128B|nr:hypothetical protein [Pseudomonas sp. CM25]NQD57434.1 hypothetical protein [Pseudomonas sp. CM25]